MGFRVVDGERRPEPASPGAESPGGPPRPERPATASLQALGTLSAGLTHEVTNPLTFVLTNLRVLVEDLPRLHATLQARGAAGEPEPWEDLQACAREALQGAERVRTLIDTLRASTRVVQGPWQPVDLNAVVEEALRQAGPTLQGRAQVSTTWGALPPVEGHPTHLAEALRQLLLNAALARPPGDTQPHRVEVRTWAEPETVCAEVRDNGPGIAPEHLPRIFEPFFTTRPVGQGVGLGLWLCHNVALAHRGHISVQSQPGQGARFTLHLPLAAPR